MRQRKSYRQEIWVDVAGESVRVIVAASQRRTMRLQVTGDGDIDLRIPVWSDRDSVLRFVNSHQDWVKERRDAALANQQRREQGVLLYGRELPFVASALGEFLVTDRQIWVPEHWSADERRNAWDKWLRTQARLRFSQLIDQWWPHFEKFGKPRPVLRVKQMRTRWGSLSSRGYINLNLALMAQPEELIELVVVHELCHLRHFDHGPGFRALMSECLPDWRERDRLINQSGLELL